MNDLAQWIEIIDCYFVEAMAQNKKAFLLYLLTKSEWLMDNHNYTGALETLKEAKEQASSCILGIIDLFRGIAEIHLSNYLKALGYFQNAEKLLLESRVYGRTLAATKNIGSCYAYLQFYDKAEEQFKIALKEAKRLKRRDLENACYISLCSMLFKQGRFKEAIIYGEKISGNEENIHFIPLAWSYYFNNDIKMCKKYRDKLSQQNNVYHQMMTELLDMYLTEAIPDSKIRQLHKMIDYSQEKQGQNNVIWCLKFLINEYKKQGDYKKVAEYQEVILKSLGYRSFFDKL